MKHTSEGIHPGFETHGRHHNGIISGPTERTNALQNLVEQRTICYYRPQTKFGAR